MTAQVGNFTIPKTELQKCYNSAIISGSMVATAGTACMLATDAMGNIDLVTAVGIAAGPHIAAGLLHRVLPNTCGEGLYFGAVMGIVVPLLLGPTPASYALGSVAAALASGYITAGTIHVLERNKVHTK